MIDTARTAKPPKMMDQPDRAALAFSIVTAGAAVVVPVIGALSVVAALVLVVRGWRWALLLVAAALAMGWVGWQANGPMGVGVFRERTNCATFEPGLQRDLCESGVYD